MARLFLLIAAVFVMCPVAAAAASFPKAIALFRQKRYAESRFELKALIRVEPSNAVYWFNLGNAEYMLKDYAGAARDFARVISLKSPLTPAAWLYRAMALRQMHQTDEADRIFAGLIQGSDTPKGIREAAIRELGTRREARKSDGKWLFMNLVGGYDSNVRREGTPVASGVTYADVGAGLRFWEHDLWSASAGYNGQWTEPFRASDLRVYGHELRANLARATGTDLILISPFVIDESWQNRPTRFGTGLRVHLRTGSTRHEFGLSTEWEDDRSLNADTSYVQGTQTFLRLYYGSLSKPFYFQIFLDGDRVNTGDETFSDGSVLPLVSTGFGPGGHLLWKTNSRWALDLLTAYHWWIYDLARKDRQWDWSLRVSRIFRRGVTGYAILSQTQNSSTIAGKNFAGAGYQRLQCLTGVTWDAF